MKFVGFTLPMELSLLERQGVANMYDRLRSNDAIALYAKTNYQPLSEDEIRQIADGGSMDIFSYAQAIEAAVLKRIEL